MISTRPYQESDAAHVCDIINECIRTMDGVNEAARDLICSKNVPKNLNAELSPLYALVAEINDQVIGIGSLDGNEIKRVYIDPSYHNSGVGKALLDALELEASRREIDELIIESSPSAEEFYAALGYQAIEPVSFKRGDAEFNCVKMVKLLAINAS